MPFICHASDDLVVYGDVVFVEYPAGGVQSECQVSRTLHVFCSESVFKRRSLYAYLLSSNIDNTSIDTISACALTVTHVEDVKQPE